MAGEHLDSPAMYRLKKGRVGSKKPSRVRKAAARRRAARRRR